MSRPKGSKNKKTLAKLNDEPVIKRGRGRPRKIKEVISEPRPEPVNISSGKEKEIKQEIRRLKKSKRDFKTNSNERKEIKKKILELKRKLVEKQVVNSEKDPMILEILKAEKEQKITPTFETLGIDLHKYTLEQLKIHLKNLTDKKINAILN